MSFGCTGSNLERYEALVKARRGDSFLWLEAPQQVELRSEAVGQVSARALCNELQTS